MPRSRASRLLPALPMRPISRACSGATCAGVRPNMRVWHPNRARASANAARWQDLRSRSGQSARTLASDPPRSSVRADAVRPRPPAEQGAVREGGEVTWTTAAIGLATTLALQIGLIAFGFATERLRPARAQGISCLGLNLAYMVSLRFIYAVLLPLSGAATTLIVNALGGGLITLPASGLGLLLAAPGYALLMDGSEYLFHRAQHRFPVLWAMHSLHHSDPAVNVSTAPRHFWGEMVLKAITIYALI